MNYTLNAVVLPAEEGGFVAYVPELPGANTQGETLEEVVQNLKEVIGLVLETQRLLNQDQNERSVMSIPLTLVWDEA